MEQKSAEVGELQRRLLGMETVMVPFWLQCPALGQEGTHRGFFPSQQPCISLLIPSSALGMEVGHLASTSFHYRRNYSRLRPVCTQMPLSGLGRLS